MLLGILYAETDCLLVAPPPPPPPQELALYMCDAQFDNWKGSSLCAPVP
jgi:hypothetical protein